MYERIKTYISRYSWIYYICAAVFIVVFGRFIFGGTNSDDQRATDHLERTQEQQRKSVELNKDLTDSVGRSARLNQQASERITRIEVYQRQASERIDESTKRLDEAEAILKRNEQLIRDVEQGHKAQQGDGTAIAPSTEYVGAD